MEALLAQWDFSPRFALTAVVLSLINFVLLPSSTVIALMQENGPIETATVIAYYLALAICWLFGRQSMRRTTMLAVSIVLLAGAARELDLHKAMFGVSILSTNFYAGADALQIAGALLVLAPVLVSLLYLVLRYGRRFVAELKCRQPVAVTIATILVILPFAKILDRSLSILAESVGYIAPAALVALTQSLEEPVELLLPLLVCIAVMQEQLTRHKMPMPD